MKKTIFIKHKLIFKMALVAVFAALNFCVMLLPKIPVPSLVGKPYVHLGNLIVILVSICFDGVTGGLSGAVGMGIYDLVSGYGIWTLKTVILKFGIGIVTGLVYKLIKKRSNESVKIEMICVGSFFILISLFTAVIAYLQSGKLVINDVTITIAWPLYVFSFILGSFLIVSTFFSVRLPRRGSRRIIYPDIQKAMYASSMGLIFNIFGELLGGFIKKALTGNGFKVSLAMSIASIPATVINACAVLFVAFAVFPGIMLAINKLTYEEDSIDDTLNEDIENELDVESIDENTIKEEK